MQRVTRHYLTRETAVLGVVEAALSFVAIYAVLTLADSSPSLPNVTETMPHDSMALAAISGITLYVFDRRAGHDSHSTVARYIEQASPNAVTSVLFGLAGLTFLLKAGGGLYWMIPAVLASLAGGVINAWLFLIKVPA